MNVYCSEHLGVWSEAARMTVACKGQTVRLVHSSLTERTKHPIGTTIPDHGKCCHFLHLSL